MKYNSYSPRTKEEINLFSAISLIRNSREAADFLRDLLTPAEITEFANRFKIAELLTQGHSYLEVSKLTGTSTATVTRVAHWLNSGCGGYKKILGKLIKKNPGEKITEK